MFARWIQHALFTALALSFSAPAIGGMGSSYTARASVGLSCGSIWTQPARCRDRYSDFLHSKKLLLLESEVDKYQAWYFPASNEFDFHNMPWDESPTDLVVGFGTNSAWDIAIRKNAKAMVIGDIMGIPLFGQDHILAPLILAAKSRADFLSMLTGIALPAHLEKAPIEDVFHFLSIALANYYDRIRYNDRSYRDLIQERKEVFLNVMARLEADRRISQEQKETLKSYFAELTFDSLSRSDSDFFYKSLLARFETPDTFFEMFNLRYNPTELLKEGAPSELIKRPFFSIFSSEEAFRRLQHLFDGNIFYAGSDFKSKTLYQKIRELGDSRGYRSYTLSITNILDVLYKSESVNKREFQEYIDLTSEALATPQHPVVIFRSRETMPPHRFERVEAKTSDASPLPRRFHVMKHASGL